MNNLITHCGAKKLTKDELMLVPLPKPMGARHVIRPITEDVDLLTTLIEDVGLRICDSGYAVKKSALGTASQVFGLFELESIEDTDFSVMVGLRGSYDQSLPRGIAVGSRVFVCDNLAFSGAISMHTKQTTFVDNRIRDFFYTAVNRMPTFINSQDVLFNKFKETTITKRTGENIIIDMFREDIIDTNKGLVDVLDEWETPTHNHGISSVWSLFNAVTETYKGEEHNRLNHIWEDSIKLTDYLKEYVRTR